MNVVPIRNGVPGPSGSLRAFTNDKFFIHILFTFWKISVY